MLIYDGLARLEKLLEDERKDFNRRLTEFESRLNETIREKAELQTEKAKLQVRMRSGGGCHVCFIRWTHGERGLREGGVADGEG